MWNKIKNLTVEKVIAYVTLISLLSGGVGYGLSYLATFKQLATVRNELITDTTEIQISLLLMKYPGINNVGDWELADQEKYNGLIKAREENEKIRRRLAGVPEGMPQ